jgi:hypothetical protein
MLMELSDIIIGRKYKCDYGDGQYFAIVKEKKGERVWVQLADKVRADGDPGDPIDRLGTVGLIWVAPESIHPM